MSEHYYAQYRCILMFVFKASTEWVLAAGGLTQNVLLYNNLTSGVSLSSSVLPVRRLMM